ncbi:MAG TPA: hypothetical protein VLT36_25035 [Candidatus Dormibacteraeota bacterium]|nr:hypothetical protein [Candidatus Dormibacteraeota bacterium]
MSFFYYIACKPCRSFVNLESWRIFHTLRFPWPKKDLFPGAGIVAAAKIDFSELRERLARLDDPFSDHHRGDPEFQRLRDILTAFSFEHEGHELYFINDSGNFPWEACTSHQWYEWREVIGPNTKLRDVDLPKNLIYDLNMTSWQEAEKHLSASHRYNPENFPDDINLVKDAFEKVKNGS